MTVAQGKTATVLSARLLGPETRLLELAVEPLGFVGGQYLIVNSGVVLDGGKLAKRAYSILSADARQDRIEIAVRRIGDGPGSGFLHAAEVRATIPFSGPWGKYLPDDRRPRATWVIATDTGITAALGLVRGAEFAPQRPRAELVWLVPALDYFLPPERVREMAGLPVEVCLIPPAGHPERVGAAEAIVRRKLARARPESVFLSGDGAVLYPLRAELERAAVSPERVRLEAFFNNPEKKSL